MTATARDSSLTTLGVQLLLVSARGKTPSGRTTPRSGRRSLRNLPMRGELSVSAQPMRGVRLRRDARAEYCLK